MKHLKFAATVISVALAGAAQAAGPTIPYEEPPVAPPPAPAPLWQGPYLGVSLGFGSGDTDFDFLGLPASAPHSISGGFVGIFGGYDWQSGRTVFGIDGSYHVSDISGETGCLGAIAVFSCQSSIDSFGALRGRIGRVMGDDQRSLIYVAGGYAFAEATADVIEIPTGLALFPDNSASLNGWTAALGFERMTGNDWVLRGEVGYTDYGATDPGEIVAHIGNPFELDMDMVTVTIGISKRF